MRLGQGGRATKGEAEKRPTKWGGGNKEFQKLNGKLFPVRSGPMYQMDDRSSNMKPGK